MTFAIKALTRNDIGTKNAKKIRNSGNIPAIIYQKEKNINISVPTKEFETEYFKGNILATIIEIEIDGKKTKNIVKDISLDPVTQRPVHIDFETCEGLKNINIAAKFNFIGKDKSPGLKRGGFLHVANRRASLSCPIDEKIPVSIDVKVDSLHLSSKIWSDQVSLPQNIKFASKNKFLICSIIGRGKSKTDDAKADGEQAAEAGEAKNDG